MKLNFIIILTVIVTFQSCTTKEVDGIIIGSDLQFSVETEHSNRTLVNLIKKTLRKDPKALIELSDFDCGGGAGCYDLGFVISQIVYKLGEKDFIKLTDKLTFEQRQGIKTDISAGLEYGDNNKDGKMDETTIDKEFPALTKWLDINQPN